MHESERPVAIVLLFHGNGEVVSDYDDAAEFFSDAGASLSVADFRGYGASTGSPSFRSTLSDSPRILEAVLAKTELPLIVMGRSLGGACAAELCREARPRVAGYVFESSGSDLSELVRRRGMRVPSFSADDIATFDPLTKMASCTTPALILHGQRDDIIHLREAEATHHAIAGSTFVRIPECGHNDLSRSNLYWRALGAFIRSCTDGVSK